MEHSQKATADTLELRNCLREQYDKGRVVMGHETVYLETVYGYVYVTCESVTFPDDTYRFERGNKSLQEYCDFIIDGIERYSSPLPRVKEVLQKIVSSQIDDGALRFCVQDALVKMHWKDYVRISSEYGDVCVASDYFCFDMLNGVDASSLLLPLYGYFYRGDMDLYEYCKFVVNKIEEYTKGISFASSGAGDEIDNSWLRWKNVVHNYLGGERKSKDMYVGELRKFADAVRQYAVYWAEYFGVKIKDVTVSVMRNWGEYYYDDRRIRLNRNLIALNPMQVKEIVLHEICHCYEHNHRYAFWKKLESMCCAAGIVRSCDYVDRIFPDKKGSRSGICLTPYTRDDEYRLTCTKNMLRGFKIEL